MTDDLNFNACKELNGSESDLVDYEHCDAVPGVLIELADNKANQHGGCGQNQKQDQKDTYKN